MSTTLKTFGIDALTGNLKENDILLLEGDTEDQDINSKNYPLSAIQVYQYISSIKGGGNLAIGGFVKGESTFSSLDYKYAAMLFSDKFDVITRDDGTQIFKRYGYGIKVTLQVTDVQANLDISFGSMAASTKMGLAKIQYRIDSFGVPENIIENYVDLVGDFNFESYQKIITCSKAIKDLIGDNTDTVKLFPIDVLTPVTISPDEEDSRSFYFGADSISGGLNLRDAVLRARNSNSHAEDEDIISFMYQYFGIDNAYSTPNETQKKRAKEWIEGTYNKTQSTGFKDKWVSVEPNVDDNGYFVSLRHLGEEYQPHQLPVDWSTRAKAEYFDSISISFQNSSEIQVSAIADVSSDYNSKTIIFDAMIYWNIYDAEPKGKILETRYGVGVRMKMKVSEMEFGTDINFASVGASAELGLANVGYEIRAIGINDKKIIQDLPNPQDLDESTISNIIDSFKKLLNKIGNSDLGDFNPQPIAIKIKDQTDVDSTLVHQSVTFAYQKLCKRKKLKNILAEARKNNLFIEKVKEVYADFGITKENDKPSFSQKRDALEWFRIE
ncbi:hypothetical protein [Persicobacter diffluens]|uniref:Uncharacterized protein n=1 Tax=Persicobacter diffluens TaxID=981 RepID=A0AAN4W365_9BACT|nr:hypothetical protein PEDI_54260 [Persicobacter diffluens]